MKRTMGAVIATLVLVLALSIVGGQYLLPLLNSRTYSETFCLTDQITNTMDTYDIAKLYRDNHATVAVTVQGDNNIDGYTYTALGSGVCVASNGYQTTNLDENIVASKGSYVVTNYHVIDMLFSDDFSNCLINIFTEEEVKYPCKLLWSNKSLDVAIIYCQENLDYVRMKDRIINPAEGSKLDYEPIFTIGTPLELAYLNRLTLGNVASNNLMTMPSGEYVYPYISGGQIEYSNYPSSLHDTPLIALYNTYEDIVDVTVGITNGNSGGGCFDQHGVLIGLTTVGLDESMTGGNQMNGIVPIYPVIEVIDRLIANNEKYTNYSIYTFDTLGIKGFDAFEASYVVALRNENNINNDFYNYFYFNGEFYSTFSYQDEFSFNQSGFYLLESPTNSKLAGIPSGAVINKCTINEKVVVIENRNDLLYCLLQIKTGDQVVFTYSAIGVSFDKTVAF